MGELQRFEQPQLPRISAETVESVLLKGDLAALKPQERVAYYDAICKSVGLNPLTRPFEYLTLNGKTILYALKSCSEQLRQIHNISVQIISREVIEGCYVVTARASLPNGRQDESIGAVSIDGLKGESRSNAMMKAETKAKRRVTLSISGLAYLDEHEVESVRGASHLSVNHETGEIAEPAPAATLTEDIKANPAKVKSTTPFNALKAFGDMHKRFTKIGKDDVYYTILNKFGVDKSNQFAATTEGMQDARNCYKELSLVVADLEVAAKNPPIPEVDSLPDPVPLVIGVVLRCKGKTWEIIDTPEGHKWSEE